MCFRSLCLDVQQTFHAAGSFTVFHDMGNGVLTIADLVNQNTSSLIVLGSTQACLEGHTTATVLQDGI